MTRHLRPRRGARFSGWPAHWRRVMPAGLLCLLTRTLSIAAEEAPILRPPRGPLVPSFWEQHGWLVTLAAGAVVVGAAGVIWRICRPKPVAVLPPAVVARDALRALQGCPEDDALVLRVSQVLRHYLTAALGISAVGLTTAELDAALRGHPRIGPELAARLSSFLRDCDVWKFAPVVPRAPPGFVSKALELVNQVEPERAQAGSAPPIIP
jgi:hypothetical protein